MNANSRDDILQRLLGEDPPVRPAVRAARSPADASPEPPIPLERRRAERVAEAPQRRPVDPSLAASRQATPQRPPAAAAPAAAVAPRRRFRFAADHLGLILSALILGFGWFAPLTQYLTPRSGLGYALGIIGGSLMLLLLVYPLRKRIKSLGFIGSNKIWFQIHMILGVAGPICIVYHCCYRLGATNSNVALISMLIVASSGLAGRYLYTRIHHGLYGHKVTLKELRAEADQLRQQADGIVKVMPEFIAELDRREQRIANGLWLVPKAVSAAALYHLGRVGMRRYVHHTLRTAAAGSRPIAWHRGALTQAADRYADSRLTAARRVAEFDSCERLFALWHVLHVPLFGMLFVAGIVHVIAVNVY